MIPDLDSYEDGDLESSFDMFSSNCYTPKLFSLAQDFQNLPNLLKLNLIKLLKMTILTHLCQNFFFYPEQK